MAITRFESPLSPESIIFDSIISANPRLQKLNKQIHDNPELCYEEVNAHENITSLLESEGFLVTKHAFGLDTSFTAEYGTGGRIITFCAEYDALPGIGHACGHNLIATSSIAAFLGVKAALCSLNVPGRVRILGCPAEEGGGGKIKLIQAGAFLDVDAALMIHPCPTDPEGTDGISYGTCLSTSGYKAIFTGKASHAGVMPWNGINALDAAALSYSAISMLRQQIEPTDRINIVIPEAGTASNIITDRAVVQCAVRSATRRDMLRLSERTQKCFEGAAHATECKVEFVDRSEPYADLRSNESLCVAFANIMQSVGRKFVCNLENIVTGGYGTDMGNVSYEVPSFHGTFYIPTQPGQNIHSKEFTEVSGSTEAFDKALEVANGIARVGMMVLMDEDFAGKVWHDFKMDLEKR